jgi:hypothetical protein
MKSNILKTIVGSILTFAILSVAAFGTLFAQDGKAELQNGRGGRLVGTWDARVSITNCQTGAVIRSFASIGTFMFGGTMLDSTSGVPQALKTPGHGVWSHVAGNTYKFSFKSFSFDAAGNFTGWTIVRHEAVLDAKGDEYTSAGTAEFYAPNGTLVGTGCSATIAARFE